MTAFMLSRIQFGLALGFHYLFPIMTLGLTPFILFYLIRSFQTNDKHYDAIATLLIKIVAVVFVFGVATGLVLPFAFGSTWSAFSSTMGEVFGPMLAIEAITAFTIESTFLALMVFGKNRVSPKMYFVSALLVFLGSHLSAFWIVAANSWMQTPAGYSIENNKLILTSITQAIFNPSTINRFFHVVMGAWLTGALITSAIAAYMLRKKIHEIISQKMLKPAILAFCATTLLQLLISHWHIMDTIKYQPTKASALEGIFQTRQFAPLYIFGIPDQKNKTIHFAIGIPGFLSFLESYKFSGTVKGLNETPEELWPNVNVIFSTFRIMELIGFTLIGLSILGVFLYKTKKLYTAYWYLQILVFCIPLPFIANEFGWISAEMGRQPWTVQGILRTYNAYSPTVPSHTIALTLLGFTLIYLIVVALFIRTAWNVFNHEITALSQTHNTLQKS